MSKTFRVSQRQREEIIKLATNMIKHKMTKKQIVETIKDQYGFANTSTTAMVLTKYGVIFPQTGKSIVKPPADAGTVQNNIDTVRHPYIKVARIIDCMKGYSAAFRDGVIYVNEKPYPTLKAFQLAKVDFPTW